MVRMASQCDEAQDLDQLTRRFRPVLMAFLLRRVRSHADAEDMTQEAFARLASQGRLEMRSPEGYLFQVAANLLRDRSRRLAVRNAYRIDAAQRDERGIDPLDPLRITGDRETLALLCAAVAELPERTRNIFLLYRLENVDRRVLADGYGISLSTVDRELARAMAALSRCMRQEEQG